LRNCIADLKCQSDRNESASRTGSEALRRGEATQGSPGAETSTQPPRTTEAGAHGRNVLAEAEHSQHREPQDATRGRLPDFVLIPGPGGDYPLFSTPGYPFDPRTPSQAPYSSNPLFNINLYQYTLTSPHVPDIPVALPESPRRALPYNPSIRPIWITDARSTDPARTSSRTHRFQVPSRSATQRRRLQAAIDEARRQLALFDGNNGAEVLARHPSQRGSSTVNATAEASALDSARNSDDEDQDDNRKQRE
jgi:hypothetical protein